VQSRGDVRVIIIKEKNRERCVCCDVVVKKGCTGEGVRRSEVCECEENGASKLIYQDMMCGDICLRYMLLTFWMLVESILYSMHGCSPELTPAFSVEPSEETLHPKCDKKRNRENPSPLRPDTEDCWAPG